jgi:hypothetical protein
MTKQTLAFAVLLLVCGASRVLAQNPNGIMNVFTAIMGAAIVNNARNEWSKVPPNQTECIEEGYGNRARRSGS